MFNLFSKSNKIKSEAHRRAVGMWKTLTIYGIKEKGRTCHFCNKDVPKMQGYLFSNRHIMDNEKYMEQEIKKLEKRGLPPADAQEVVWQKLETIYDDWLVCEDCLKEHFI
ncbi:MAG: hypothetical protein LWY06_14970 [Firmicutes bacterium]|nr:hypothetical protein [Bacillota bacterium]